MAKSKSGGTRSYIRGRVGADVYSIGKDAKGKKQQVVRSLAETVANPQTIAQMRGRMIMSTVMQAQSVLKPIIDHSFDNVAGIQPNLSEFIRRNYSLVKADVAAHPAGGNAFGLNAFQEKGAKQGAYIISDGKAAFPAAVTFVQGTAIMTIALGDEDATMAGLKAALGLGQDDYMTIVGINLNGGADYARLHVNFSLADSTALTSENIDDAFNLDGNAVPAIAINGKNITVAMSSIAGCSSVIITRKTDSGFIHSKAVLGASVDLPWNANAALPTYPIGEQKFLNGGSSDAQASTVEPTPVPTPTPDPSEEVDAHLTTFNVAGQNVLSGSVQSQGAGSKVVGATLADKKDGSAYALVRKTGAAFELNATATDNAEAISGTTLSSSFEAELDNTYYFALTEDTKVIQVLGSVACVSGSDPYGDGD